MTGAQRRFRAALAVAATTVVPAVGIAVAWRWADARASTPEPVVVARPFAVEPPTDVADTQLLSYRRTPAPIAAGAAEDAERQLVAPVEARFGTTSCAVMAVDGVVVAAANPTLPMPSSTSQQLVLAAVALDVLGADFRFRTDVRAAPVVDGVVGGDLFLIGGGDPGLSTLGHLATLATPLAHPTVLDGLADAVVAAGVAAVDGNIVGDGTRYDDEFGVPTWDPAARAAAGRPYDALVVDDGRLDGGGVGLNPNQAAASRFNRLLSERGVAIAGRNRNGPAPIDGLVTLATIESAPLGELVTDLLASADATTAELLLKELGVATSGVGTRHAGIDAVRATLARWGVPTDGLALDDGSGLGGGGRISCATMAAVVDHAGIGSPLAAALPVAGPVGQALAGAPASGLRAHGMTRPDLRALTGLVPDDGRTVAFSVVLAEPGAHDDAAFLPVRDALLGVVDGWPPGPDVADLAPR